jgi:uncharacterized protein with GYD domain
MATYIVLFDWTDQGIGNFKDTVDRYEAAHGQFEEMGVTLKDTYWTMGGHDLVAVAEAPDDQTLAAALLTLASLGNLRTTTLRAFTADEMREVIAKTG